MKVVGLKEQTLIHELKLVHQSYDTVEPSIRLFINTFEAFISVQQTMDDEKTIAILRFLESVGASNLKSVIEQMMHMRQVDEFYIPLKLSDETFTVKEVADLCGVSQQIVRRACEEGKIQASRGKKRSWIIDKEPFLDSELYHRWIKDKEDNWKIIEAAAGAFTDNQDFIKGIEQEEENRKSEA